MEYFCNEKENEKDKNDKPAVDPTRSQRKYTDAYDPNIDKIKSEKEKLEE